MSWLLDTNVLRLAMDSNHMTEPFKEIEFGLGLLVTSLRLASQ